MLLSNIKVVDFTTWAFAPSACAILGDWGAEVIKIETPDGGDPARGTAGISNLPLTDIRFLWELDNRNKRSAAINLKTKQGKDIVQRMVRDCDVFVSNIRADPLQRLGLDYDALSKTNPKLIYAHASGYGGKGMERERAGYDYAAFWARSGIMDIVGEPGSIPPQQPSGFGDHTSSIALACGIVLALYNRERFGIGQKVEVSLFGTALWCSSISLLTAIYSGKAPPKPSRKERINPLYNSYQVRDGRWIMLVCMQSDRYWPAFCRVLGREELKDDPRFNTHSKRMENNKALISILDEALLNKTTEEWGRLFDENGILWAPAQSFWETAHDPQALDNEFIVDQNHPTYGTIKTVASPIKFSKTPAMIRSPAPELGQHTEEILLELGYTWEDITAFKKAGAIL